ncbi:hypothetical protein [Desulfocurvus sp. DL9XJH121]
MQSFSPARVPRGAAPQAADEDREAELPVLDADLRAAQEALAKEDAQADEAELERQARLQVVRDYIETCGAPEEKDQTWVVETFWKRLQEQEDDTRGQGLPGNALNTWADVIQDPEDQGEVHVYTVKTDAEGKGRITRHVKFDSGDGEDRSQLTPERAKAAKAYARQSASAETGQEKPAHKKDGRHDDEA